MTTEFSDDENHTEDEERGKVFLWNSLFKSSDKIGDEESWSKRNLFAVFVLIPLSILLLSMSLWSVINGISLPTIWPGALQVKRPQNGLDFDLLMDKILSSDKFNELVMASSADSDKLMFFAQAKLDKMEAELKRTKENWLREMQEKIDKEKESLENLKKVASVDDLKIELEKLKKALDDKDEGEILSLKSKINELMEKHEDLAQKLTDCQRDPDQIKLELSNDLKKAFEANSLGQDLMTKEEFNTKILETQSGLESKVLEKVQNDPIMMEKMRFLASQNGQKFSKEDVVSIVHEALTIYDADKTGLFDFAMESAGGSIASIRCTETYDITQAVYHIMGLPVWWERQNPRTILQPASSPGQCWAFKGAQGCVVVKLSNPVFISEVTLEHIPKSLSPDGNVSSAPRHFQVLGLTSVDDPNPVQLGNFTYQVDDVKHPVQTFSISEGPEAFAYVELKVLSNHGHPDYTCLYRFRVHGSLNN